jgi:hypothetical protein
VRAAHRRLRGIRSCIDKSRHCGVPRLCIAMHCLTCRATLLLPPRRSMPQGAPAAAACSPAAARLGAPPPSCAVPTSRMMLVQRLFAGLGSLGLLMPPRLVGLGGGERRSAPRRRWVLLLHPVAHRAVSQSAGNVG